MRIYIALSLVLFSLTVRGTEKPYFQQEVHYKISVKLNDVKNTLKATEELEYINRSSDTLTEIWFHLWPNGYADRNSALCKQQLENGSSKTYFAKEEDRGYIDSLAFTADDVSVKMEYDPQYHDICKLILNKPLLPGQRVFIRTPFFVKIPSGLFSRMGHIGQAYAITQWYPKPAVYDRYGWHAFPYLDQGEFYSEFGSYDVNITVHKNYVIGATGDLVDGENEIAWLTANADSTAKMTVFPKDLTFPPSDKEWKTLHYKQTNVHDFGWFADKRFHVLKGEATMPATGKKVTTWAMFTNSEAPLWMKSIEYINDALVFYSSKVGDYPYNQCTAVDGTIAAGGGMEYPNFTIIGKSGDASTLETTIVHEVGHNWFYGMLGSNEREHPWMDEGINSFYEMRYYLTKYPPAKFGNHNDLSGLGTVGKLIGVDQLNYKQGFDIEYKGSALANTDQPIEGHSTVFSETNYGTIVYRKTGVALDYLRNYLGDSIFDSCMHSYFQHWCYHHPYPSDFEKEFIDKTGDKLNWFFTDVMKTNKKMDYSITGIHTNGDGYTLKIRNRGDYNSPFPVAGFKDGNQVIKKWIYPTTKDTSVTIACKDCDEFKIDPQSETIDVNSSDKTIRTSGILKKIEPLSFNFASHLEYPYKSRIYFLPLVAWNEYDHFMAGLMLHNLSIPGHNFEYQLAPLYSFSDHSLNGLSQLNYKINFKEGILHNIIIGTGFRRFGYDQVHYFDQNFHSQNVTLYYNRFNPSLTLNFRPFDHRSRIRQAVRAEMINIRQTEIDYKSFPSLIDDIHFGNPTTHNYDFYRLIYNFKNARVIDPLSFQAKLEGNKDYSKIAFTFNYKITYNASGKGIDFRFFAGKMLTDYADGRYNFNTGDRSSSFGSNDYTYDDLYFGRSATSGILSQQIAIRDGGFKLANPGSYNKWLLALNIKAALPIKLPIQLFADIGTYNDISSIYPGQNSTSDAGICLSIARNAVEVYFPLIYSKDVKDYYSLNNLNKYSDQIRIVFNLQKMNPFLLRDALF